MASNPNTKISWNCMYTEFLLTLVTNIGIPNDEGLRALRHFLDQRTVEEPSTTPSGQTSTKT